VAYVGFDPVGLVLDEDAEEPNTIAKGIEQAEKEWAADLYGLGASLVTKRQKRNPWGVWQGVFMEQVKEEYEMSYTRGGLMVRKMDGHGVEMIAHETMRPW
jgi:hypothetical protein